MKSASAVAVVLFSVMHYAFRAERRGSSNDYRFLALIAFTGIMLTVLFLLIWVFILPVLRILHFCFSYSTSYLCILMLLHCATLQIVLPTVIYGHWSLNDGACDFDIVRYFVWRIYLWVPVIYLILSFLLLNMSSGHLTLPYICRQNLFLSVWIFFLYYLITSSVFVVVKIRLGILNMMKALRFIIKSDINSEYISQLDLFWIWIVVRWDVIISINILFVNVTQYIIKMMKMTLKLYYLNTY